MSDAPRGTRRVGVGMMLLCWVVILALALWWFRGLEARRDNPNLGLDRQALPGEPVTLVRNGQGHFVAPGHIGDRAVTFLVDTGATYVSLSRSLAQTLGLREGAPATFSTANGRVDGHLTTLPRVRLGGLEVRQVPGSIHAGIDEDLVLLGMSFLGRFDIQIRGDQMVVSPPSH